jgi:hypothetical protein
MRTVGKLLIGFFAVVGLVGTAAVVGLPRGVPSARTPPAARRSRLARAAPPLLDPVLGERRANPRMATPETPARGACPLGRPLRVLSRQRRQGQSAGRNPTRAP